MDKLFGMRKQVKQISGDGFKISGIPSQTDRKNTDVVARIDTLIRKIDEMLT